MALVHALVPPRAGSPSCVFCQRRPQLTAEAWMRCASDERTQSQHSQQQLLLLKSPPPRPRRTRPRERTCSQQQRVRGGAGWNLAPRAAGAGPQPQRAPSEDKALTSDGLTLVNFRPSEVKFGVSRLSEMPTSTSIYCMPAGDCHWLNIGSAQGKGDRFIRVRPLGYCPGLSRIDPHVTIISARPEAPGTHRMTDTY